MKPSLTPTVSIIATPTAMFAHSRAHFATASGETPLPPFAHAHARHPHIPHCLRTFLFLILNP